MWNQTIPKSQKVHPGPVTVIEEHPVDPSKLLIGLSYQLIINSNIIYYIIFNYIIFNR